MPSISWESHVTLLALTLSQQALQQDTIQCSAGQEQGQEENKPLCHHFWDWPSRTWMSTLGA